MILTLSTTLQPATDFGYLLMKHPDRVHECVFSVLALETDPMDPRL